MDTFVKLCAFESDEEILLKCQESLACREHSALKAFAVRYPFLADFGRQAQLVWGQLSAPLHTYIKAPVKQRAF